VGWPANYRPCNSKCYSAKKRSGEQDVEVTAGGGAVKVVMTGHQKLQSVTIDPEVVNPEDVEMLQDLIVAAINEAVEASQKLAADEIGSITGGLNLPGLF